MNNPMQPNVKLSNDASYRENYANSVQMRVNIWDFFLVFGTLQQQTESHVEIRNFQGIYLSPQRPRRCWAYCSRMSLDTRARLARSNSIRAWAPQGRCIKSAIEGTAAFPRLMCRRAAEVILKASLHVECFSHAIEPAPRAGVCGRVRAHFFAACATPAA